MQLTTDDRLAGLEAPDGRGFRPDGDGVIHLPDDLAGYGRQAARAAPMFHIRTPLFSGFDASELAARYAAWEQGRKRGGRTIARVGAAPAIEAGGEE